MSFDCRYANNYLPEMKQTLEKLFQTKQEKIAEKAFSQSLFIPIAGILICIVLLCYITFVRFSKDVSNNTNNVGADQELVYTAPNSPLTFKLVIPDGGALTHVGP